MANQPGELDGMLATLQEAGGVTHYVIFNKNGAPSPVRRRGPPGAADGSGRSAGVPLRWQGWKNTAADYSKVVHISALVSGFSAKSSQYVAELLRPGEVRRSPAGAPSEPAAASPTPAERGAVLPVTHAAVRDDHRARCERPAAACSGSPRA